MAVMFLLLSFSPLGADINTTACQYSSHVTAGDESHPSKCVTNSSSALPEEEITEAAFQVQTPPARLLPYHIHLFNQLV